MPTPLFKSDREEEEGVEYSCFIMNSRIKTFPSGFLKHPFPERDLHAKEIPQAIISEKNFQKFETQDTKTKETSTKIP